MGARIGVDWAENCFLFTRWALWRVGWRLREIIVADDVDGGEIRLRGLCALGLRLLLARFLRLPRLFGDRGEEGVSEGHLGCRGLENAALFLKCGLLRVSPPFGPHERLHVDLARREPVSVVFEDLGPGLGAYEAL